MNESEFATKIMGKIKHDKLHEALTVEMSKPNSMLRHFVITYKDRTIVALRQVSPTPAFAFLIAIKEGGKAIARGNSVCFSLDPNGKSVEYAMNRLISMIQIVMMTAIFEKDNKA